MNNKKVWYKSVTVWYNVALILIALVENLSNYIPIPASLVAELAIVGNILLRFKTDTALVSASSQE